MLHTLHPAAQPAARPPGGPGPSSAPRSRPAPSCRWGRWGRQTRGWPRAPEAAAARVTAAAVVTRGRESGSERGETACVGRWGWSVVSQSRVPPRRAPPSLAAPLRPPQPAADELHHTTPCKPCARHHQSPPPAAARHSALTRTHWVWMVCPQRSTVVGSTDSKRNSKQMGQFWCIARSTHWWLPCNGGGRRRRTQRVQDGGR